MPKLSYQVGSIEQLVPIFVQDATVSTGAGFPNLLISTFSSYYYRSDMTSTSSVTLVSTGTLGTWSSGQFRQINSTFMRGWYQFCLPNGMLISGSTTALHMYGHPSMAPVVAEIEITRFNNQRYVSSEPHNVERLYRSALVTTAAGIIAAGPVGVSSVTDKAGYSVSSINTGVSTSWFSGAGIVTTLAGRLSVDVSSIMGTKAVTTVAGYLPSHMDLSLTLNSTSTVNWSSFRISTSISSMVVGSVNVSSFAGGAVVTSASGILTVNLSTVYGSNVVTTAAGVLGVGRVGVSSMNIGVAVTTMSAPVDVSSVYASPLVTTAAGVLAVGRVGVSSMDIGVGVTTFNSRVGVSSFDLPVGVSSFPLGVDITSVVGITVTGLGTSTSPWGPV